MKENKEIYTSKTETLSDNECFVVNIKYLGGGGCLEQNFF
jgi:hypothetical protein